VLGPEVGHDVDVVRGPRPAVNGTRERPSDDVRDPELIQDAGERHRDLDRFGHGLGHHSHDA
jgi:hypothetical protein